MANARQPITLIMPYYNNGGMLEEHIRTWSQFSEEVRRNFKVILIDDGSSKDPAEPHLQRELPVSVSLYKVLKDIPWNQHGARNLGLTVAPEGWCLATDMDHVVSPEFAERLIKGRLQSGAYYTFGRVRPDGEIIDHPHKNTFLVEKKTFWKTGGYDEDFCGTYGGDGIFRRCLDKVASIVIHTDFPKLINYKTTDIADCNTRDFDRKGGFKERLGKLRPERPLRFPWKHAGEFGPTEARKIIDPTMHHASIGRYSWANVRRLWRCRA